MNAEFQNGGEFRLGRKSKTNLLVLLLAVVFSTRQSQAQTSAFTYQGRLSQGSVVANGNYDFRFTLFDSAMGGTITSGPVTNATVGVSNGLFSVTIDFGLQAFDGGERWIEIGVRTNSSMNYADLNPRQPINATPYAVRAANFSGSVTDSQLSTNISRLNENQIFTGNVWFNSTSNSFVGSFGGNGAGLSNIVSSSAGTVNGLITIGGAVVNATLLTNPLVAGNGAIITNTILPGAIWSKCPVPPLILSSFVGNVCNSSEDQVRADIESSMASGLMGAGWTNYMIEDGQYLFYRDISNNLVADPVRFPSGFPYIVNYAHTNGFRIGSYITGGYSACCPNNNPGTPPHLAAQHIQQIVDWGFDGLLIDGCSVADPTEKLRLLDYIRTFNSIAWDQGYKYSSPLHNQRGLFLIAAMNDGTGGGIPYEAVYSVNVLGINTVAYTNAGDQANMLGIGHECIANQQYVGPGHYLDPTAFDCSANSFADYAAAYPRTLQMMISIYAMCAAPMQINAPVHYNDSRIWADLSNRGPLNILQDRAVIPCSVVVSNANEELWVRPLGGINSETPMTFWRTGLPLTTSNAFLYLNKTTTSRTFDVTAAMLGRANSPGIITVVNAWSNRVDGTFGPGASFTTPPVPANRFYLGVAHEAETFANFSTTSSNLAAAVTDKTGSGLVVFANSPTLVGAQLVNATATSLTNQGVGASKVVVTDSNGREVGANLSGLTLLGTTLSANLFQTPWTNDINGGGFQLTNASRIISANFTGNGAGITNVGGLKVYRGLVSQTGSSAPTETVLENSLGGAITWSRTGAGIYAASLTGGFPPGKTLVMLTLDATVNAYGSASRNSTDSVTLATYDGVTRIGSDGKLNAASLEILVYP